MSSGTLLASQSRKIKRKSRYQGTRFVLRIKIIHLCGLFAKHAQKFCCLTQRHRWRHGGLAVEAIETIIWKLPTASVVRIVSKYFETAGAIGTIRTITWKPGFICVRNAPCTVCVSVYEKLIAAVLFNYRGLYRYRSRRKQRVNGLVPVPRGSQVRVFFCRVHYRICASKQEISSGTGTCF